MMDATHWRRIRNVFETASELSDEARRAYLDGLGRDDPDLRGEVESLLAAVERHPDLLNDAPAERGDALLRLRDVLKRGERIK